LSLILIASAVSDKFDPESVALTSLSSQPAIVSRGLAGEAAGRRKS
jgi:hypothetical protein